MTTTTITKNRTTDLEQIRELAREFLSTEVTKDDLYDDVHISHPAWDCRVIRCDTSVSEKGFLCIVDIPEDYEKARAMKMKELNAATTPLQIFKLFTENWKFRFLNITKEMMPTDDLSEVLRHVWHQSEYADNTHLLNRQDVLRLFRECNPRILMSEAEYKAYQALPEELTVYRGVHQNNKQLVRAFSWTLAPEEVERPVCWETCRFASSTCKAFTAKVKKGDVLAYFEHDSEVVVNPSKLYDIETYSIGS